MKLIIWQNITLGDFNLTEENIIKLNNIFINNTFQKHTQLTTYEFKTTIASKIRRYIKYYIHAISIRILIFYFIGKSDQYISNYYK